MVVGDVSGKGLHAAMMVAMILGSLANEAERNPASLLAYLNNAVTGRTGGGLVTACCARIYPDGRMVTANAGQLSPYLENRELPAEAWLPLGIVANTTYTESCIVIDGATVTWLSDGVLEARNPPRSPTNERPKSPTPRKKRGKDDDITVLRITRLVMA